jgi:hypothetical protein
MEPTSPYLRRPLRTLEQALADRAEWERARLRQPEQREEARPPRAEP